MDEKIKKVAISSPQKSFGQICVLACLNIAAEMYQLKEKKHKVKEKINQLIEKLEKETR